jgi:hypothetical protein
LAEVASKPYRKSAKNELEKQLAFWSREAKPEIIKRLGLPKVLMFLSTVVAKGNNHQVIDPIDVQEANAFLRYFLSREMVGSIVKNRKLNLGLPQKEQLKGRLLHFSKEVLSPKEVKLVELKVQRLVDFLENQKLGKKHVNRIKLESRATIHLFSKAIAYHKTNPQEHITKKDINTSYDIFRFLIFDLETTKIKILKDLYSIDNSLIWKKIPKITFDQSAHDHLSKTAYARWENLLPDAFGALKKKIGCSSRPFLGSIQAYSELHGAITGILRVGSHELLHILDEFERFVFGNNSPIIIEQNGVQIRFTEEGLLLLSNISKWITSSIVNKLGKDEFVFNYSSTVPRQLSLIFVSSLIEQIQDKDEKIDCNHIAKTINKWCSKLQLIKAKNTPIKKQ